MRPSRSIALSCVVILFLQESSCQEGLMASLLLKNSFVYQVLDALLIARDGHLDEVGGGARPDAIRHLNQAFDRASKELANAHNANLSLIQKRFPRAVHILSPMTVNLDKETDTRYEINHEGVQTNVRTIARVAGAIVIQGLMVFNSGTDRTNSIRLLEELHKAVSTGKVKSLIKDAKNDSSIDNLVDFTIQSRYLEVEYFGTLMFMLAHEQGHYVLGHLDRDLNCAQKGDVELEADRYAAYLLAIIVQPIALSAENPDGDVHISVTVPDYAANFFDVAYRRAGFSTTVGKCEYPATERRKQQTVESADLGDEDARTLPEPSPQIVVSFLKKNGWTPKDTLRRADIYDLKYAISWIGSDE